MEQEKSRDRGLIGRSAAEFGIALLFLIAGAVVVWDSYQIGAGWGDRGPESGYFPLRIGIIVCIAAVAVMIETWRKDMSAEEPFVTSGQLKPVLQVLLPIVLFVVAAQFLGMYVAAFGLIAGFMRMLGKYPWWKGALVAGGVTLITFWLFEIQFMVPLIKGPIEAALGY